MPGFFLAYLFMAAVALLAASSFFVSVSVRNRLVTLVAQAFNIICNPLATGAEATRAFSATVRDAVPETAFADGVIKRILFAVTFVILLAVDVALAGERMAALFGMEAAHPPFDVSWATGFGWVVAGGFFASVSLDLRHEVVGHPFDRLAAVWIRRLRIVSDCFFVVVLSSALVFYVAGSLLVAGSVPLLLVVVFMGLLGVSLVAASGLSFWAGVDSWTTIYGVAVVIASYAFRLFALVPELLVVSLRRTAYLVMAAIDLPFLGAAYPLLKWWAASKFGKALGFPPLEEPIPWPPVGYVEVPAERFASRTILEPFALAAIGELDELSDFEEAA
ncbi:MAG: hypothetical protein AB7N24_15385 [Dehalococcoidia bacterium]